MSRNPKLTPEQITRVRSLRDEGLHLADLATRFGVSISSIRRALSGRQGLKDEQVFQILCGLQGDADKETLARQLAKRFEVSKSTIYSHWRLAHKVSERVWETRRAEIQDEWTRRGAPDWRVRRAS